VRKRRCGNKSRVRGSEEDDLKAMVERQAALARTEAEAKTAAI
jgi:hypothetical protein